jgi:hypothetical protein
VDAQTLEALDRALTEQGVAAALARLVDELRQARRYHQMFDARLLEARQRLGLPILQGASIDELPEPTRAHLEEAYLQACREVGLLFLEAGQLREAWMYLRPAGEREQMAAGLASTPLTDETLEPIIEIALHEGVDPVLGYRLVLSRFGTCSAITMFDSVAQGRTKSQRRELAALLIQHVHDELETNVRADIHRREGAAPPKGMSIAEMVAGRPELFADLNYHVDASHLAATVRVARLVEDRAMLALALDLARYGNRLDPTYQYQGEPPFRELYPASALFFGAQLGENVEEAVEYFRGEAQRAAVEETTSAPAEVFIALLARLGRFREAIEASPNFLPEGAANSAFAPTLLELASLGDEFDRVAELLRERDDPVGYLAARIGGMKQ